MLEGVNQIRQYCFNRVSDTNDFRRIYRTWILKTLFEVKRNCWKQIFDSLFVITFTQLNKTISPLRFETKNITRLITTPFQHIYIPHCFKLLFLFERFSIFLADNYKIVWCKIVVWGKGFSLAWIFFSFFA